MKATLIMLLLTASPLTVIKASGFYTGARDTAVMAQANAGLLTIKNASLAAGLAAAMVHLEGQWHASFGISQMTSAFSYENLDGTEATTTSTDKQQGAQFFSAWKGSIGTHKVALGSGFYVPYHAAIKWPKTWAGSHISIEEQISVALTPVVAALEIDAILSVAAGVNIVGVTVKKERRTVINKETDVRSVFGGSGDAVGYQLSFFVDEHHFSYGARYHSMIATTINGGVHFDAPAILNAQFPDGDAHFRLHLPWLLEFSAALKEQKTNPKWQVEAMITNHAWSLYKEIDLHFSRGFPQAQEIMERHWNDALALRMGGYYNLTSWLSLRLGLAAIESPVPEETLDPGMPDGKGQLHVGSGLTVSMQGLNFDIGILYATVRTAKTELNNAFTGIYKGHIQALSAGIHTSF